MVDVVVVALLEVGLGLVVSGTVDVTGVVVVDLVVVTYEKREIYFVRQQLHKEEMSEENKARPSGA